MFVTCGSRCVNVGRRRCEGHVWSVCVRNVCFWGFQHKSVQTLHTWWCDLVTRDEHAHTVLLEVFTHLLNSGQQLWHPQKQQQHTKHCLQPYTPVLWFLTPSYSRYISSFHTGHTSNNIKFIEGEVRWIARHFVSYLLMRSGPSRRCSIWNSRANFSLWCCCWAARMRSRV